jgi:hypothetical protein
VRRSQVVQDVGRHVRHHLRPLGHLVVPCGNNAAGAIRICSLGECVCVDADNEAFNRLTRQLPT